MFLALLVWLASSLFDRGAPSLQGSATDGTPGMISMFGSTSPPSGWLLCDGTAVSRTTYGALFGVIGTSYGTGDGSTTFNVPNFKAASATTQRFPVGWGTGVTLGTTTANADSNAATTQGAGIPVSFIIKF